MPWSDAALLTIFGSVVRMLYFVIIIVVVEEEEEEEEECRHSSQEHGETKLLSHSPIAVLEAIRTFAGR